MRTGRSPFANSTGLAFALIVLITLPALSQSTGPGAYGECAAPATQGINICNPWISNQFPYQTPSPFQIIAAATSTRGQVAVMELWADGQKIVQTTGSPLNVPVTLSQGNHELTVVEVDETGFSVKSAPFAITVVLGDESQSCSAPDEPGVHVCTPQPNGCNGQGWVQVVAKGKGQSGTVKRMELWNGINKIANFSGDLINTSFIELDGDFTIFEVDSKNHSLPTSFHYNGPC